MKCEATTADELQKAATPWPKTIDELSEYIKSLLEGRQHDYNTCVYAISLAALAAFNFVASELGCSGFQASCADLDFLRRNRSIKGPFTLIDLEDMLYPQYDVQEKFQKFIDESRPWLSEQAKEKLKENHNSDSVHPAVRAHWEMLATQAN